MCSTIFPINYIRTTSPKTTFRLPSNDEKWRSPATSRSGGEVELSRRYTRRFGSDSPNRPGSGRWTSNSLAPTSCVIGPALRTSTAKPTIFTAGRLLARPSVSFPGTTANTFWRRATLRPTCGVALPLSRHGAPQRSPRFVQGRRWVVVACKHQCEYDGGWGIPGPHFGPSGAVQAPTCPGALHDLRGGRTRFFVPAGSRSQRVLSEGST